MTASPGEHQSQPLSEDEIARLDALKRDDMPAAILIVVIALVTMLLGWERYGAFWTVLASLVSFALAGLTLLVRSGANASLQADMDGGIKRLAVATVVKVTHRDEQSRHRIELRTEETPPCTLEFIPPASMFFEVEYGEQVQVAYAPVSKTVIRIVALGYEYELGDEEANSQAAPEQSASAESRLQQRRAQRDAARTLRRTALSTRPEGDVHDDAEALRPQAEAQGEAEAQAQASIERGSQPARPRVTMPLDGRDRGRLASRRMGGRAILASVCVTGLFFVAMWALSGVGHIDAGAIGFIVFVGLFAIVLVAFVLLNEDDKVQSDLDAQIKVVIAGRISDMRTETSEGGSPYCFITVTVDESPPRRIVFLVESRLFHALLPGDAVRIVYVPVSKTILDLRTDSYRYSLRQESD